MFFEYIVIDGSNAQALCKLAIEKSPRKLPTDSLVHWISETHPQGFTDLQSLVKCLDHRCGNCLQIVSTSCKFSKSVQGLVTGHAATDSSESEALTNNMLQSKTVVGLLLPSQVCAPVVAMLTNMWERLLITPKGGGWGASPWTIVGSFLTCTLTLAVLDISGCALPRKPLKRADRIEWNVRLVSSIHAVVLVLGAYLTWQETRHLSDYSSIFGIAWAPDFFARIFIGYLVYDMVVMVWYYKELQDPTAILHHFIFLMAATYVVAHSIMAYPFSWLAFTEVSTPFLNIRWHFAVLGWKDGPGYLYNGLALLFSFIVSRVILYGLGLLDLFRLRHLWLQSSIPLGYKVVVALFGLGWLLNVYWGRLIVSAAVRAFSRADKKKHSVKSQ